MSFFAKMKMPLIVNIVVKNFSVFNTLLTLCYGLFLCGFFFQELFLYVLCVHYLLLFGRGKPPH